MDEARLTSEHRARAVADYRALTVQQRRDAYRHAREGRRHPDPEVARVVANWALAYRQTPQRRWDLASLVIGAALLIAATVRDGSWWPLDLVVAVGAVVLLFLQLGARSFARRVLALPATVEPPRQAARRGAAAPAPGVGTERVRILSDADKQRLGAADPPSVAAGWYADPLDLEGRRYWNGAQWTGRTMKRPVAAADDAATG